MEVDYLLIGHGRDGEIERDEYPKERLIVFQVQVRRAGDGHQGDPIHSFEIHRVNHKGSLFAVGLAKNIDEHEIKRLIDESGMSPIPEDLL
ncbi:hypothetical protein [Pantoea ananatis]|uniref:hypothetical protein n=1 Tax=Pantoea ananas TaxID=553 RepID=UPI000497406C|nr:hypothetical protein [Pantoea ananatis]